MDFNPASWRRPALYLPRAKKYLARRVKIAATPWQRLRGLLGESALPSGQALAIPKCAAVHMFFMRLALDVVFVDAAGRVVKIARHLKPWQVAGAWRAKSVFELPVGAAASLAVGDTLRLVELADNDDE